MNAPCPLEQLPNGATVLAVSGNRVLCHWGPSINPYVYWRWGFQTDSFGNQIISTVSGHYFPSLSEAVESLIAKIGRF